MLRCLSRIIINLLDKPINIRSKGRVYFAPFFVTLHHLPSSGVRSSVPSLACALFPGYLASCKKRVSPNVYCAPSLPLSGSLSTKAVCRGQANPLQPVGLNIKTNGQPNSIAIPLEVLAPLSVLLSRHPLLFLPSINTYSSLSTFLTAIPSSAPQEPGKHQERRLSALSYLRSSTATFARNNKKHLSGLFLNCV
ncbi:hypothetical protein K438DRAFT_1956399 [Mycena galopus ATCC 62051]|nr:hypothetical protein K438DRAFT_1956399 [Mycena galopus ATCC 62051]